MLFIQRTSQGNLTNSFINYDTTFCRNTCLASSRNLIRPCRLSFQGIFLDPLRSFLLWHAETSFSHPSSGTYVRSFAGCFHLVALEGYWGVCLPLFLRCLLFSILISLCLLRSCFTRSRAVWIDVIVPASAARFPSWRLRHVSDLRCILETCVPTSLMRAIEPASFASYSCRTLLTGV